MNSLWGFDLGGTKIEGVILKSIEDPKVLCRLRVTTEANLGYEHILNQIEKLLRLMSVETSLNPVKIGIGTPGTLDPEISTLKNSNTVCLNGKTFQKDLQNKLKIPIAIANDANCFAHYDGYSFTVGFINVGS